MNPVTGIGNATENENVMAIGETADTIGQGDLGPLTDARTAGQCKTVSANHTGATNTGSLKF
jgi:hypothetical protein